MLTLTDLSVAFGSWRLGPITLDLRAGEVLALIGASGAGKSLLAHAILGLLPPDAVTGGTALLDGRPIGPSARGRIVALMPQQPSHLDPTAPVGTQLRWAARRGGKHPPSVPRGLLPHQLSGGMARLAMLGIAEAGDPRILIADEPTAGLDPAARDAVLARLTARARRGGAVLLITHDLPSALPYADRVAILHRGRLCGIEPASAFQGSGDRLLPEARAMWRALPQNGMHLDA